MARNKVTGALVAACVTGMALAPAAGASPSLSASQAAKLQRQVEREMQRVPGGTRISRNEIAWHGGRVIARLPIPGEARAAGSFCTSRAICLYANANQGGTKMTYRCGNWDVTRWFPPRTLAGVSSWHSTARGSLSNIPAGSPPGTVGQGITIPRSGRGNVAGWFNDQARSVSVC